MNTPHAILARIVAPVIMLSLLVAAAPAGAQDADSAMPGLTTDRRQQTVGEYDLLPASQTEVELSLRDAVTRALRNHPDLQALWHSGDAESMDSQAERSSFDTFLEAAVTVPVSTDKLVYSKELANVALTRQFTSGVRASLEYHLERDPDGLFVSENGSSRLYRHRGGLKLVQPLARGRGSDANLALSRAEDLDFQGVAAEYRRAAKSVVYTVEDAYWRLFAAQQIKTVFAEALTAAENLLKISGDQFQAGELSRLELTVAEAGVASRREDVILARIETDKARDALLALLLGSASPSRLSADVTLLTLPDTLSSEALNLLSLTDVLANRQDYVSSEMALAAADEQIKAARNLGRHRVDLTLEMGYASMGPSLGTEYIDPTTGEAVSGAYVFVGGELGMSLNGTHARADKHRAAARRRAAHYNREAMARAIVLEIRQARLDLESSIERIRVTRTAREAVEEQLRGERKKFAMGRTTNQSALLYENDLRSARIREIRALADLQVAAARLRLAMGTTLDHFDLALQ